jgi:diguanylate cyclase (GGDEF)-like protein
VAIDLNDSGSATLLGAATAIESLPLCLIIAEPSGRVLAANAMARRRLKSSADNVVLADLYESGIHALVELLAPALKAAGRALVPLNMPSIGRCIARVERLHSAELAAPMLLIEIEMDRNLFDEKRLQAPATDTPQVVALRAEANRLRILSQTDRMTGLLNTSEFGLRAQERLATHLGQGASVGLLFIDINDFKAINDTLGHEAGDVVICSVGQRLRSMTTGDDLVGRVGGDEFCILTTKTGSDELALLQERLRRSGIGDYVLIMPQAAVGVATSSDRKVTLVELRNAAEADMYAEKRRAKARAATTI